MRPGAEWSPVNVSPRAQLSIFALPKCSRGGLAGLGYVQAYARHLLANGWDNEKLAEMDRQPIARHLSPGGSADLLAVAWVLGNLVQAKGPP